MIGNSIQDVLLYLDNHNLHESLYTLELESNTNLKNFNENTIYVRNLVLQGAYAELLALVQVLFKGQDEPSRSAKLLVLKTQIAEQVSCARDERDMEICKKQISDLRNLADQGSFKTFIKTLPAFGEKIPLLTNRMKIFDFLLPVLEPVGEDSENFQPPNIPLTNHFISDPKLALLGSHREPCPVRVIRVLGESEIFIGTNQGVFSRLDSDMSVKNTFPIHQGSVYAADVRGGVWALGSNDEKISIARDFRFPSFLDVSGAGIVRALRWVGDTSLVSSGSHEPVIRCWDVAQHKTSDIFALADSEHCLSLSVVGDTQIAAVTSLGHVRVFDRKSRKEISDLTVPGVFCSWSNNNTFVLGTEAGAVSAWDMRNFQEPVWEFAQVHAGPVRAVAGSGAFCLTASFDKTVKLLDVTTGHENSRFATNEKLVACDMMGERAVVSGAEGGCFLFSIN